MKIVLRKRMDRSDLACVLLVNVEYSLVEIYRGTWPGYQQRGICALHGRVYSDSPNWQLAAEHLLREKLFARFVPVEVSSCPPACIVDLLDEYSYGSVVPLPDPCARRYQIKRASMLEF